MGVIRGERDVLRYWCVCSIGVIKDRLDHWFTRCIDDRDCVGCAIVKGDHAPDCGVAQGIIHGVVGHHGKKEEEAEEELGQEVKGQEEENAQTPVRMTMTMDEMEKTRTRP